jgi:TolB-like protein/class 3 adenylate cyclase/Tfp pilus assembly protein PilF
MHVRHLSEDSNRLPHRLTVVWFADLVGYSSLAARDQDRAIALVRRFQAAVRAVVTPERGRIVKFIGDAALMESGSAEYALLAAAELQESLGEGEPVRTGVHLGDVAVAEDGDLYGDGVNVAQRIQTEAEPGQIVVSEDVARGLRSRPAFRFAALGERHLKGIQPMELFAFVGVGSPPDVPSPSGSQRSFPASATPNSIAVLPFANLSADPTNEYFSDGITEEILTALAKLGDLKVISRTSVMRYKGTTKSAREIGNELQVRAVLEGSVRRAGERVRITAQLIEASTDAHLWAESYDRDLVDIFAIQTDVAERIVEALRVQLSPRERARIAERPTESVDAYESYLKARYLVPRRTEEGLRRAIASYRRALDVDSSFALAWAGMAEAYALLPSYSGTSADEAASRVREAAKRALAIDPALGGAHAALGLIAQSQWQWQEADRELRRAIELSPGYATAYHWYGNQLAIVGSLDEALAALNKALELDPLSLPVRNALLVAHTYMDRLGEAADIGRKIVELDAGNLPVHVNLAEAYDHGGRFAEALHEWGVVTALAPDRFPASVPAALRAGYEDSGRRGYWQAWIDAIERAGAFGHTGFYLLRAHAQLGQNDEAFAVLDRLVSERNAVVVQVRPDLIFEPLRSDPRFEEFLQAIGLPSIGSE